jgi:hypothetical protein
MEYAYSLRYKLRMMGMTVDEPMFVFGDNQSVLTNTTAPVSTLRNKSNAISYHFIQEGCARNQWHTAYVNTKNNVADLIIPWLVQSSLNLFRCYFITMCD